jgi:hypothetical protein
MPNTSRPTAVAGTHTGLGRFDAAVVSGRSSAGGV